MNGYFVLYHNEEKMGTLPSGNSFFTKKKLVEHAIGGLCFFIVGRGKGTKQYYLWSHSIIDKVKKDDDYYIGSGKGIKLSPPVLLNNYKQFEDFKNFCGNFGLGFQSIVNHPFCDTLISLSSQSVSQKTPSTAAKKDDLQTELIELNKKMKRLSPEKVQAQIELTIRKDQKIVNLLKKSAHYKCQFPDCTAIIKTTNGNNYVEVAHIRPVNKGGKSIIGNLVVLCPNHHKEFDLGDLKIKTQTLNEISGTLNGKGFKIDFY